MFYLFCVDRKNGRGSKETPTPRPNPRQSLNYWVGSSFFQLFHTHSLSNGMRLNGMTSVARS